MALPIRPPGGSGNARSLRLSELADFRGGLNLSDDLTKVQMNESPDMSNLDVHARGGLVLRGGMRSRADTYSGDYVHSAVFNFQAANGNETSFIVALTDDGTIQPNVEVVGSGTETGALGFPVQVADAPAEVTSVQMNDQALFMSPRYAQQIGVWDGTTLTWSALGVSATGTWGVADTVPRANVSAVWDNRMWVGSTVEDGVSFRNRIRWSSDGDPTTFAEDDWIDIDVGEDGDQITAMAVFGEVLAVFKRSAMYLVLPVDDGSLYRVVSSSQSVGASGPRAVVSTPFGLMFWDSRAGLHAWNSQQPFPLADKISQAIHEGRIPFDTAACVSWVNERVWVTVDFDGERTVLVLDPSLGAWTRYSPAVEKAHRVGDEMWGYSSGNDRWLAVDILDQFDDFGGGAVPISAYWVSPWLDGGQRIVNKRWRRPRFLAAATNGGDLEVDISADFDPRHSQRQFSVGLPVRVSASAWGGSTWGGTVWAADSDEFAEILQGPAIGNFRSIQMRVSGPTSLLSRWRLDAVTATYKPKVLRS